MHFKLTPEARVDSRQLVADHDRVRDAQLTFGVANVVLHLKDSAWESFARKKLAETYGCSELADHTLVYIAQNGALPSLNAMIMCVTLAVTRPLRYVLWDVKVVQAVVRWLEHEPDARTQHNIQVLRLLPLDSLPKQELDDIWKNARHAQLARDLNTFAAGMLSSLEIKNSELQFGSLMSSKVSSKDPPPLGASVILELPMYEVLAVKAHPETHKALYLMGGKDKTSLFKYILGNKAWEVLTPMTTVRERAGFAALGGRLYVAGGLTDDVIQNACSVYDPASRNWNFTLAFNRMTSRDVVSCSSRLCVGEFTLVRKRNKIVNGPGLMMHPGMRCRRTTPRQLAGMSRGRVDFCLAALGDKLYAFGYNSVDVYDPAANTWTLAGNVFLERETAAVATYKGELLIVHD
ncbi:Kelch-like protein 30 [Eumeta japonica]|uniref:Kelch-like protein 30 n=1 Tax=Eumeta variegata TaxID=151549 RepID=A0A4C1XS29_EUMVA|nr:Kelch-like protein 30 [Eumeta japonica]